MTTQRATKRAIKTSVTSPTRAATRRIPASGAQRGQRVRPRGSGGGRSGDGTGAGAELGTTGAGSGRDTVERPPENRDRARILAVAIAEIGLEHKALNVEIIDVRGKVDYSDYVVVMSGRSDRQVNALGRHIEEDLLQKHKARCLGVEGMPSGTWLLMDYSDVVVHIFHEDTRGYYDLETLWIDAARVATDTATP